MRKISLILINFLVLSSYAVSDLYSSNPEVQEILKKDMYEPNIFSMLLGLFLCIGLIYLTSFIYQKLIKVRLNSKENDELNKINIISTTSLGQNKNLHIIKINGEYSLIGSCQNNISFIKDIKQE